MASVVCRMVCNRKRELLWATEVFLDPVTASNDEKNSEIKEFCEAIPAGSLHLFISDKAAAKHLELDGHYYVTLEPVNK